MWAGQVPGSMLSRRKRHNYNFSTPLFPPWLWQLLKIAAFISPGAPSWNTSAPRAGINIRGQFTLVKPNERGNDNNHQWLTKSILQCLLHSFSTWNVTPWSSHVRDCCLLYQLNVLWCSKEPTLVKYLERSRLEDLTGTIWSRLFTQKSFCL